MTTQNLVADYDPNVSITDFSMVEQLGDTALLGNWFVFLKAEWLNRSGMARLLELSSVTGAYARSNIIFRGKSDYAAIGPHLCYTFANDSACFSDV